MLGLFSFDYSSLKDAAPVLGGLFSGAIGGFSAIWISKKRTLKHKRAEATIDFNQKYQSLKDVQCQLNQAYSLAVSKVPRPDGEIVHLQEMAARWWEQYFDLMQNEYFFFREGMLDRNRYIQWMRWRYFEYREQGPGPHATCNVGYRLGWRQFKSNPALWGDPFVTFFDRVHHALSPTDVSAIVTA